MAKSFITFEEAAVIAGVSVATVRRWVSEGIRKPSGRHVKLLAMQITGQPVTTEIVIRDFMQECNIQGNAAS